MSIARLAILCPGQGGQHAGMFDLFRGDAHAAGIFTDPQFEAALSLLPVLPPEEVTALLEIRLGLLKKTLEGFAEEDKLCREMNLPRLFSLESEYAKAVILAEYKFSEGLLSDIKRDAGGLRRMWTTLRKTIRGAKPYKTSTPASKPLHAIRTRNGRKGKLTT